MKRTIHNSFISLILILILLQVCFQPAMGASIYIKNVYPFYTDTSTLILSNPTLTLAYWVAEFFDSDEVFQLLLNGTIDPGGEVVLDGSTLSLPSGVYTVVVSSDQPIIVELFPLDVTIAIQPDGHPSTVRCTNDKTTIEVAILTTETFDALTVDHTTVTFEGASELHYDKKAHQPIRHEEDVDQDGDLDLVFHFRFGDTTLSCESKEGTLTGETYDGLPFQGTDNIRMSGG